MIRWHDLVVEQSWEDDMYRCHYCKRLFQRNKVCGDHVATKGSSPNLKFDVSNGVCCCAGCNISGSLRRVDEAIRDGRYTPNAKEAERDAMFVELSSDLFPSLT